MRRRRHHRTAPAVLPQLLLQPAGRRRHLPLLLVCCCALLLANLQLLLAAVVEQQQQQQPAILRHFFVPARLQAAQKLRSRAIPADEKDRFRTVVLPGGQQFVLVPRHFFMQQRRHFLRARQHPSSATTSRSSTTGHHAGGVSKDKQQRRNDDPPPGSSRSGLLNAGGEDGAKPSSNISSKGRQLRRGSIMPRLRSLSSPAVAVQPSPPAANSGNSRQQPRTQFTQEQQVLVAQQQPPTKTATPKAAPPTKADVPPNRLVPEVLSAKQRPSTISSAEVKRRQEDFLKAQQRELERVGGAGGFRKVGKSRPKDKTEETSKKAGKEGHGRELLAQSAAEQRMRQIIRERTFSVPPPAAQIHKVPTTTTTTVLAPPPLPPTTAATTMALATTTTTLMRPSPAPTARPLPPATTTAGIAGQQHPLLQMSTISAIKSSGEASASSPSPAGPPAPIPTATASAGRAPAAPPAAGPPGQLPPSDNVVAELNNAHDFMEVANRLRLREVFSRRKQLATH